MANRMTTRELRDMCERMPRARLRKWINESRRVMRQPDYIGPQYVGGRQGPDRVFCARVIAVARARLACMGTGA